MESYTIEDIEVIREKSGISYQEAVALLDYHNGNLARALIDLERNGRLVNENGQPTRSAASGNSFSVHHGAAGLFNRLTRARLKISRNKTTPIMNVSVLYGVIALLVAPHLAIGSAIAAVLLGYNFAFDSDDSDFSDDTIEKMVRSAKDNARSAVSTVVRNFSGERTQAPEIKSEPVENAKSENPFTEPAPEASSYFTSNPAVARASASAFAASDVPTIQVPVQVEANEGNVTVEQNEDGSSSVTVG